MNLPDSTCIAPCGIYTVCSRIFLRTVAAKPATGRSTTLSPLSSGAKQPSTGSPTPLTHSASRPYQALAVQHRKRPTKRRQTATHWLTDITDTLSVATIPTTGRPTTKIAHQASPNSHGLAPQQRSAAQRRYEASPWPNHPAHTHASEAIPPQHGLTTTLRITRPETRSPEPTSTGTKSLQQSSSSTNTLRATSQPQAVGTVTTPNRGQHPHSRAPRSSPSPHLHRPQRPQNALDLRAERNTQRSTLIATAQT